MMKHIANDYLTRVKSPGICSWPCPKRYTVGEKGDKNGCLFTIKRFALGHCGKMVWMIVRFVGDKKLTPLWIGNADGFKEKLIICKEIT